MTIGDRTAVGIQLLLYAVTQLFNVLTDVGLLVESWQGLVSCDHVLDKIPNTTVKSTINCSNGDNFTESVLEGAKVDVFRLSITLLFFSAVGLKLFIAQVIIFLKYLSARGDIDFEHKEDTSKFLKHFYVIHGSLLLVEAIFHDLTTGFIVVELCVLVWKQPNCWECDVFSVIPKEMSRKKTSLWLGIKLVSLVPTSMYKGMLPLFMWIGGPFCGMDCYICRVCIVVPAGLVVALLLMTPICGAVMLRLIPIASDIPEGAPNTVWSIGLIFWAIVFIIVTLGCVICVPCCRTCCFRHGICKCLGLDFCGLAGPQKRESIPKPDD